MISGLFAAFSRFTRLTFLVYGVALAPFLMFDVWFTWIDPIFTPVGGDLTFGEMEPAAKDAISHRARAFAQLKAALFD